MLSWALQNRFPVQPVVRLVADKTAHGVASGEALACAPGATGLARIWQMCLSSPGLPFHSKGPCPHLPAAAVSQLNWTRMMANAVTGSGAQVGKAAEDCFYGSTEVFYGGIHLS